MEVSFKKSFLRDLRALSKNAMEAVEIVIEKLKNSNTLQDTKLDFVKMKGAGNDAYYRIRIGSYRIGIEYLQPDVIMITVMSRGDIYKHFPPS